MAGTQESTNFGDRFVREYVTDRLQQNGESSGVSVPGDLSKYISPTGYFDPSKTNEIFDAINASDPQGAAALREKMGQKYQADTSKMKSGDTLNWNFTGGQNDWAAPVAMLASFGIGGVAASMGMNAVETALMKAGFSLATGANPMTAVTNGGLSMLTNTFTSGGSGGVDLSENSFDNGSMSDAMNRGGDVPVGTGDPNVFASAGTSDTGYGAGKEPTFDPGAENSFDTGQNQQILDKGGYKPGGIIDSLMNWAENNPSSARLAAGLGAGALGVVGGIGSALLNKDTAEKRIQAEKDMLSQKTAEDLKAAENKRAMVQSGSYFDSKLGITPPVKTRQLRRPDGSPVYSQPGIITGQMNQPPR